MSLLGDDRKLLDALSPRDRQALLILGTARQVRRGAAILRQGEQSRFVALITAGWVTVSTPTCRGDSLILAIRGAGDVVGDLAALDGRPRSATVTALDDIRLVVVPGDRFKGYLTTHPAAAAAYMRNLGARLRDADAERRALVSATVLQRLARRLVELATQQGLSAAESMTITPALPQRDLAASIGATQEAVAKALRVLRERDIVRTAPRRLVEYGMRSPSKSYMNARCELSISHIATH